MRAFLVARAQSPLFRRVTVGGEFGGADVLLDAVYLVRGDVNFVAAVVFQQQVVALGPVRPFQLGQPAVAPDAVQDMDDEIPLAQFEIRGDLQALFEGPLGRLLVGAVPEDVRVRGDHQVRFGQLEAAEERAGR